MCTFEVPCEFESWVGGVVSGGTSAPALESLWFVEGGDVDGEGALIALRLVGMRAGDGVRIFVTAEELAGCFEIVGGSEAKPSILN